MSECNSKRSAENQMRSGITIPTRANCFPAKDKESDLNWPAQGSIRVAESLFAEDSFKKKA
ncbi:MAG: hypothetical protein IJU76_11440 [Desulfovibrionaceae bacterium]|nr:hypothetical protein [Desulfovibrionaceae bacterium]